MGAPRAAAAGSDPRSPAERPPIPRDRRALCGRGMFADRTAPGADVQSLWRSARSARCEAVRDSRGGPAPRACTTGPGGGSCQGCAFPGSSGIVSRLSPSLFVRDPPHPAGPAVPARPGTETSPSGRCSHRSRPGAAGPVSARRLCPVSVLLI